VLCMISDFHRNVKDCISHQKSKILNRNTCSLMVNKILIVFISMHVMEV